MIVTLSAYASLLAAAIAPALGSPIAPRAACDCYRSPGGLIFTKQSTMDFRSLASYASSPAAIETWNKNVIAPVTSTYFNSKAWVSMFQMENWSRPEANVPMINTKNNVYISSASDASTYLTLRTHRSQKFQSSAELTSISADYTAVSWRIKARAHGDYGSCMGMFTYKYDGDAADTEHEQDIEFLTRDKTTTVHYTTHPENDSTNQTLVAASTQSATLPQGGAWTDFHEYRMDWTSPSTSFYVDGFLNGQLSHALPQPASQLKINTWSKGGTWERTMAVGGYAYLDIQWLSVAYNTSDSVGYQCQQVCSV